MMDPQREKMLMAALAKSRPGPPGPVGPAAPLQSQPPSPVPPRTASNRTLSNVDIIPELRARGFYGPQARAQELGGGEGPAAQPPPASTPAVQIDPQVLMALIQMMGQMGPGGGHGR